MIIMNPTSLFLTIIGSGSLICHVIAFGADVGKHSPSRTKNNRSSLLHDVNDMDPSLVPPHEEDGDQSLTSDYYSSSQVSSRKQFLSIITTAATSTAPFFLGVALSLFSSPPSPADADEPSNFYNRSKSDGEDPLVVFGKSLEIGIADPNRSRLLDDDRSQLTLSDISLPSATTTTTTSDTASSKQVGGDLNKALQKKVEESQAKRAINPLTHG